MKTTLRFTALLAIIAIICATFVSCGAPDSDPSKAVKKLKENNVNWAFVDDYGLPLSLKLFGVEGVDTTVTGTGKIDDKYAHITIVYFHEAKDAKTAYEKVEKYSQKNKGEADDSEWIVKRSGKMVYFGTKEAIKAAK